MKHLTVHFLGMPRLCDLGLLKHMKHTLRTLVGISLKMFVALLHKHIIIIFKATTTKQHMNSIGATGPLLTSNFFLCCNHRSVINKNDRFLVFVFINHNKINIKLFKCFTIYIVSTKQFSLV